MHQAATVLEPLDHANGRLFGCVARSTPYIPVEAIPPALQKPLSSEPAD
jgi:hypothetical protein